MPNVDVNPTNELSSHDVSLSNGIEKIGLTFADGPRVLQEIPISPNSRDFSHEQKTYFSGMSRLRFKDDPNGYWDSYAMWTMTDGKLFPMLQWKYGSGYRDADTSFPGDVSLQKVDTYIETSFTAGASYNASKMLMWLDWRGSPGSLSYELCADSAGDPGSVLKSGTIATTSATRYGPTELTWSGTQALTASTVYHVKIYHAGTNAHHWLVGVDADGAGSQTSPDDAAWSAAAYTMYYRVVDSDAKRELKFFEFKNSLYAVSIRDNGSSSQLYINGDRFKATSANSTSVTDTSSGVSTGWATNQWAGAWLYIWKGTGSGQTREIASNTSTAITVSSAFDTTPDTTSQCVVYSTGIWQSLSAGLGVVTGAPLVTGSVVYFPQGSTTIREMQVDYTNAAQHGFGNNGSNTADLFVLYFNPEQEAELWKADVDASKIARATESAAFGTALTFHGFKKVGFPTSNITNMIAGRNVVIFKEDNMWNVTPNRTIIQQYTGLASAKDPANGKAAMFVNSEMWWGWSHSIQRMIGNDISDMLLYRPRTHGLQRPGVPKDAVAGVGWKFFAIDGEGQKESSIICFNGYGWIEIFRSWSTADRIRNVHWQVCPGTRSRLWFDVNGELCYIEFPLFAANPLRDSSANFQHYGELITSTFDGDDVSLYKMLSNVRVNLEAKKSSSVIVDYQTDGDVGTSTWYELGEIVNLQRDDFQVLLGEIQQFRLRFRFYTTTATSPPVMNGFTVSGYVFSKLKYQWISTFKVNDVKQYTRLGEPDFTPDEILSFLQDAHENGSSLVLRSTVETMDGKRVVVGAPVVHREWLRTQDGASVWGGTIDVSFREA